MATGDRWSVLPKTTNSAETKAAYAALRALGFKLHPAYRSKAQAEVDAERMFKLTGHTFFVSQTLDIIF
jgi:transposase